MSRTARLVKHPRRTLAALALRPVRMLLIGLPALLIAAMALASLWRDPEHASPDHPRTETSHG